MSKASRAEVYAAIPQSELIRTIVSLLLALPAGSLGVVKYIDSRGGYAEIDVLQVALNRLRARLRRKRH